MNWYHFLMAFLAALIYRFPSRKLIVIGVTGTNGKSTTVYFITRILEEAGFKVASLSTIDFKVGEKSWQNMFKMTMPGRFFTQWFLRQAVNSGCDFAVLEVTSEGIKQYRHMFVRFDTSVFTNLSPEHIEAHGGYENYRKAKGELFRLTKNTHIINVDDKEADFYLQFPAYKKYTYGMSLGDINAKNTNFKLAISGDFNIYNALAAICVGMHYGVDLKTYREALGKIKVVEGRMEEVISFPFKVFVDYAFTPNSLEKVYISLKSKLKSKNSKLVCVLGACGGGRDKWKREVLGEIASRYCEEIIITNEDPYDEDPMEIIEQVAKGTHGKCRKILNRREGIRESLSLANTNDIVVITGKGCEPWIVEKKGKKIPWDDREVVKEEFKNLKT